MLGHRTMTIEDYTGILRRRWLLIVLPTLILPVLAYVVSMLLPARYKSETLVMVEQPKVPDTIVRSTVTDQLNQRLSTMTQRILSRSRLEPIIQKFELYKDEVGKVAMEDLVARLRTATGVSVIKPVSGGRGNEVPGFTISFTADNPRLAQQVCQELLSMFVDENIKYRMERATDTTEFLDRQVEEAKRKLDERDQKLADFKRRYIGTLPGQEQTNMQLMMSASQQMEAATAALNRAQQDRAYTQSQLDQAIAAWKASQTGTNPQTLDLQLTAAQATLDDLLSKYTPDHPDVIKQKNIVAQLKKKIEDVNAGVGQDRPTTTAAQTVEPPNIQQLRSAIHQYDMIIKEKSRDQERLQEVIKTYRSRVEISPLVDQQFKELTRDYAQAQQFYDEMLQKRSVAAVARDLEGRQQSEQFRVMDPPNLPEKPSFPNRLYFALGGLGGGFALGFIIALLLELRDKSLRNERDIEAVLQLPTLALIPTVNPVTSRSKGFMSKIRKTAA